MGYGRDKVRIRIGEASDKDILLLCYNLVKDRIRKRK